MESKTVIVCRWCDSVHIKPYRLHQKSTKPKPFCKRAGCSQYSSIEAIFVHNEISETEIKGKIPFTIATRKIKYLGINLTKEGKDLYSENYRTLKKDKAGRFKGGR